MDKKIKIRLTKNKKKLIQHMLNEKNTNQNNLQNNEPK